MALSSAIAGAADTVGIRSYRPAMPQLIYLKPDEHIPYKEGDEDKPWLIVEPFDNDGKFYGTGGSHKPTGEWVGYASLAENDVSLEKAIAAAQEWAQKYSVPVIHVRIEPETDE